MVVPTLIKEHMEVLGSDGAHVGTVDHMEGADDIPDARPASHDRLSRSLIGRARSNLRANAYWSNRHKSHKHGSLRQLCRRSKYFRLPYLFRSTDHRHRVLDGPIGNDILQSLEPYGFVGLAFFESGARSVYTVRRPVLTIDGIKGLRIRLQQSDLMIQMFTALGAEPVLLPYSRTKTALVTGLIDAAENNWPSYVSSGHYSVARYFALTEHTMTPDILIMSMKTWRNLSPADQNIFRNAARDASIFLRGQWKDWEASSRKQALDSGVTVIEIDRKPLEAALTGLSAKVLTDSRSRHLVESIQKDQ
jgi:TRAP-type C4-dicarboxylate transport system substrate-binding protein